MWLGEAARAAFIAVLFVTISGFRRYILLASNGANSIPAKFNKLFLGPTQIAAAPALKYNELS
jgi:hypothetical protein